MAHLLLIDPDPFHLELLSSFLMLRRPDYKIWTARDGNEAVSFLYYLKIDLVVMELELEGIDGLELLSRIAKDRPQIPVIVVTSALPDFSHATHALGATKFLSKPVREDHLMVEIELLLRLHTLKPLLGFTIAGLLQMISGQADTCVVTVLSPTEKGRFYFVAGRIVHAETSALTGDDAFYAMALWELHHFDSSPLTQEVPTTINNSLTGLLMEAALRIDEAQAI